MTETIRNYSPAAAKQRIRRTQGKPIAIAVGGTAGGVYIRVSKQAVYDLLATGEISAEGDALSISETAHELLIDITDAHHSDIRTPAEQRQYDARRDERIAEFRARREAADEWTDDLDDAYHDSRADL